MQRRFNFLTIFLVSFTLFLGLAAALQGAAYAQCTQCPDGKVLVRIMKKTVTKKGRVKIKYSFKCVKEKRVPILIAEGKVLGIWAIQCRLTDESNDGTIELGLYNTFDSDGTIEFRSLDGFDGAPFDDMIDMIEYHEFDTDGNPAVIEYDFDNDGTLNRIDYFAYDSDGNLLSMELDIDHDGLIDKAYFYELDSEGRRVVYRYVNHVDPSLDKATYYTYSPDGSQRYVEVDEGDNGSIDREWMESSYYDPHGNKIREDIDLDYDGTIDHAYHWTFDYAISNNPVRHDFDAGNDGIMNTTYYYYYDNFENLIRGEKDTGSDGILDRVQYYSPILL